MISGDVMIPFTKKSFFYTLLFALMATNSLECCHLLKAGRKIRNLNKALAEENLRKVRRDAEIYRSSAQVNTNESESYMCSIQATSNRSINVVRGTVHVGTDNSGSPIILAYLTAGNKTHNKGKMLCSDTFLGSEGFRQQAEFLALQGYYVIAVDPLGTGLSSTNDPVAMDGVKGYAGYSYDQTAALYHQALVNLGVSITTAAAPLTLIGTSADSSALMSYAFLFKNDPLAASYLVAMQPAFTAAVSDTPCSISEFTTAEAEALAQFYAADRCTALCLIYSGNHDDVGTFSEIACPSYGAFLLEKAVEYGATTPPNIFTRRLVTTLAIDQSALMAQISIPVLITNGGIFQDLDYKQLNSVGFGGICYACQPDCENTSYVFPFQNVILYTYLGANAVPHVTRSARFNVDVVNFVKQNAVCDPYLGLKLSNAYACATTCVQ
jgi:pimeloyl-ACP methyl ester carboxylesterase